MRHEFYSPFTIGDEAYYVVLSDDIKNVDCPRCGKAIDKDCPICRGYTAYAESVVISSKIANVSYSLDSKKISYELLKDGEYYPYTFTGTLYTCMLDAKVQATKDSSDSRLYVVNELAKRMKEYKHPIVVTHARDAETGEFIYNVGKEAKFIMPPVEVYANLFIKFSSLFPEFISHGVAMSNKHWADGDWDLELFHTLHISEVKGTEYECLDEILIGGSKGMRISMTSRDSDGGNVKCRLLLGYGHFNNTKCYEFTTREGFVDIVKNLTRESWSSLC